MATRFFGYPAKPEAIGQAIESSIRLQRGRTAPFEIRSWPQVFQYGEFIDENILGAIDDSELCYFDVSVPNFNVYFEIGYSVGRRKPIVCLVNQSIDGSGDYLTEIGLLDTIGLAFYSTSNQIVDNIYSADVPKEIYSQYFDINTAQPVFFLTPKFETEVVSRIRSTLSEANVNCRTFDPSEESRMSMRDAVKFVAESAGVLTPYLGNQITDSLNNNLRSAFVSGLARGMEIHFAIMNLAGEALPIDVRDFAHRVDDLEAAAKKTLKFALDSLARLQVPVSKPSAKRENPLGQVNLGNTAAENEVRRLQDYFVETAAYRSAIDGHARLVVGRKGSGKTAIFSIMGRELDQGLDRLVLLLKPDGYQLRKFKDNLIQYLADGTKEHTVAAFWEYAILLELCQKFIEQDAKYIGRNPRITDKLRPLIEKYREDIFLQEGDFSERNLLLLGRIEARAKHLTKSSSDRHVLRRDQITELVYNHDIRDLRSDVIDYLSTKRSVSVLIDNLDKGWEARGVSSDDILMLRTLIEAGRKLERSLGKEDVSSYLLLFLRNDVYELLVDETPDRGKEGKVAIDWADKELLKRVIEKRIEVATDGRKSWSDIASNRVDGTDSLDWVVDRSVMRPRYLIDLVNRCVDAAASSAHDRIQPADFKRGFRAYSLDVLINTNLEIRDTKPSVFDAIFALRGLSAKPSKIEISLALMDKDFEEKDHSEIIDILVWYGVLGIIDDTGHGRFIYEVDYNSHVLDQVRRARESDGEMFEINKVFWPALDIDPGSADQKLLI